MTDKDPEDMTASDLLWKAVFLLEEGSADGKWISPPDCIDVLRKTLGIEEHPSHYSKDVANSLKFIADKIDAELAQARKEAVKESKKPMWWFRFAISQGEDWPAPQDGETFRHYLDRCFIPRPRFEDGEPVQFGDSFLRWDGKGGNDGENVVEITVMSGDYYRWGLNGDCCTSQLVKRPAPEVLGADGLPVVAGEEVWSLSGTGPHTVGTVYTDIQAPDGRDCPWADIDNDGTWACVESLTHTPPETQARIDDDATLHPRVYYAEHIGHDVDLKDDAEVTEAMVRDLLRRQRELDKRKGGAE